MSSAQTIHKWRVHRYEHADGRWCELASNLAPEQISLPPAAKGYKFISSVPLVRVDSLLSDEGIEAAARAMSLDAGRQRGLAFEDDWTEITEQERGGWRQVARAALDAVTGMVAR